MTQSQLQTPLQSHNLGQDFANFTLTEADGSQAMTLAKPLATGPIAYQ